MQQYELTILMPCLNEAKTLATCIQKATAYLMRANIRGEIVIADNGSTDGSQEIARELGATVISIATPGYGAALNGGIRAAQGKYIIMGDADDSYDFQQLDGFLAKLREGYDLVMGNRFKGGIIHGAMPFLNRYVGNPILSFIGRVLFRSHIGDFHCGLRGFHRETMQQLNLQGQGMEFASEMVVKATLKNLTITEVPTQLYPDGRERRPHLRPWRDGWRHLRLLFLFSPRWLFLYPGIGLLLFGAALMALLSHGPVTIHHSNLDIHTLLFSGLFIIVGWQAISFAVFAKIIGHAHMRIRVSGEYFHRFLKNFTLERGLMVGFLFVLAGVIGSCYAFGYWLQHSFGPLNPTQMMRILIPAVTFLILGMQIMFASFFMSVLGLHYKNDIFLAE